MLFSYTCTLFVSRTSTSKLCVTKNTISVCFWKVLRSSVLRIAHLERIPPNTFVMFINLFRAMVNQTTFTQKLHLIYLVNDLLHHW